MKRSILIVDDEFGLAQLLRDVLTELDYDVAVAMNGRAGLEVFHARHVDVVLTDLMMPIMNGVELARAIRSDPEHQQIPIVLMTSLPTAVPREAGLYNAVLRKPFTQEVLLMVLDAQFGGH
jgi:CheY-like chemotaxis protein